ncbi:MAG TPA: cytochrome c peroxidase [Planctomycetota bacterium]|nr:cytochrome c peroxidase [Planctomycetota bacterium]
MLPFQGPPRLAALLAAAFALAPQGERPRLPEDRLPRPLHTEIPRGFPEPTDDGASPAQVDLGRRLFFDPLLSADRSVSCASCHDPEHGFASREALPPGALGRRAARNAPTLFNRGWGLHHMWDGRSDSLEAQVLLPIENELEMALPLDEALERLRSDGPYAQSFAKAFGAGPARESLAGALASFVRRLSLGDSPVDRFRANDFSALDPDERVGLWIYESKGACWRCHSGPNFTDEDFHATGVGSLDGVPEPGRYAVTGRDEDRGRFKTPTLRGLAFTAPYMHDGSLASLEDVVEFYARGGTPSANLDPRLQPIELSDREKRSLAAFLRALSRPASEPAATGDVTAR